MNFRSLMIRSSGRPAQHPEYQSCAQAMLRGNYALIDQWVCKQASVAREHGFELGDLVELLRICRNSAIEFERWDPDFLLPVNEVINEALRRGDTNPIWSIPTDLDYLGGKTCQFPVDRECSGADSGDGSRPGM